MTAPAVVLELVERFDRNLSDYKNGKYNETQVRREFIDPLFMALGWDVDNTKGYAEAYKDVIHEDALKVGGVTKAPDYCFRIGGARKFFLEAKKPSVNIRNDVHPAFQLRRYAWSAKLPLSVLTDFEELAVYDCRMRPVKNDKSSKARIQYITYDQYPDRWDEISGIFHRQSVLQGSFDKYVESTKRKKGTAEVDDEFLKEIESWRDLLARNIALRNPGLTQRNLNFCVQRTIDRIIFLRICEDRRIEKYGRLQSLLNGGQVYGRLLEQFQDADDRYNSGLFHFNNENGRATEPDQLTPGLSIDDKALKEIVKRLYYPDSPYEFSVLPADILGQVYEQFLGKVIRLSGKRAVVEEKPEVRKAGGVYYTPTYIVDYIVKNTVGKLLDGSTPKKVEKLKVLDPACGSGSFLIRAYQHLLDWHLEYYLEHGKEKHRKEIYEGARGVWKLTTDVKKKILLNNIYGVDIDPQAVEVTKLSLLLKVMEGADAEQFALFQKRVLPDLGGNIKCGNSLIGSDFYQGQQLTMLDEEEMYRINAFDWDMEFSDIMKKGGFDAVVGNPPYGMIDDTNIVEYLSKNYSFVGNQYDNYLYFLERYKYLLKNNKPLGVIVSNTWLQSITYDNIRKYIVNHFKWIKILNIPYKIFKAVVDTHVLILAKGLSGNSNEEIIIDVLDNEKAIYSHTLMKRDIPHNGECINITMSAEVQKLMKKIFHDTNNIADSFSVYNGTKPFEKGKGKPPQTKETMIEKPFVKEGERPDSTWTPLLRGSLIHRYKLLWSEDYWIKYGPWLAAPRKPDIFFVAEKILVRQTGDSIIATFDCNQCVARDNLHIILSKKGACSLYYLLGIINSKLVDLCYTFINPEKGEALAQVKKRHVEQLPIRTIDFDDLADVERHDRMVQMVEAMLEMNKKLADAKTDDEKKFLQRRIDATDRQIDQLVYELYGLTEEEIAIVEEG